MSTASQSASFADGVIIQANMKALLTRALRSVSARSLQVVRIKLQVSHARSYVLNVCRMIPASMPEKGSQLHNSPDRVLKNMAEPADAREAVQQHRQLTDITNTCEASRIAPAKTPRSRLCSQDCTAATVGDMVTFWEQRARAPLHTSCPH
jgi:hypothetical protein